MRKNPSHNARAVENSNDLKQPERFGLERLIFFSDAVFAIAITVLVLEIRLPPTIGILDDAQLLSSLISIWPSYLAYIISFLVIGSFWIIHHHRFTMIQTYDGILVRINLLLLMTIAFIPFPTAVLSEHNNRTSTIFYALTMVVAGLLSAGLWIYASRIGHLVGNKAISPQNRWELIRIMVTPIVFLLSIGIAYINPDLAKFSWALLLPLLSFVIGRASNRRPAP